MTMIPQLRSVRIPVSQHAFFVSCFAHHSPVFEKSKTATIKYKAIALMMQDNNTSFGEMSQMLKCKACTIYDSFFVAQTPFADNVLNVKNI